MTALPDTPAVSGPPSQVLAAGIAAGRWQTDPAQQPAVLALDRLYRALAATPRKGLLERLGFAPPPPAPRGIYLWGTVGRGKTFLVDLFFAQLSGVAKRRIHFHRFMADLHASLAERPHESDPLARIAAELAEEVRVLVLDEFVVVDIGDAMILYRLLDGLFRGGVVLVTTSNMPPADLYRDGLQRDRFKPAIALLEQHCEVVELGAGLDYRLRELKRSPVWVDSAGAAGDAALEDIYLRLTRDETREPGTLDIGGRQIDCVDRAEGVVWFTFEALCRGPRASADYLEIARDFHTVLIGGIPILTDDDNDAARRFIHLIDTLYDRGVNLVASAAAAPAALYTGERLAFEFERTASRLAEMQTDAWFAAPHRP